jgi:peptide/nickel transport system substrate-binding protein
MIPKRLLLAATMGLLMSTGLSHAADLVIGSSTEPQAIDPEFSRTGNNQNIAMQIFDRLVTTDANLQIHPGLAVSWTNTDPTTWVVKLREGVTFTDGKPLTADDVIFSLDRADKIPNSPAPFSGNVAEIASMKAVDPLTIEFKTKDPTPDFIEQIGFVYIVEKAVAQNASLDDFNSGKAAIGTGPYKFVEWVPSDHLTLERNDHYWGTEPDFKDVTIKFISNDAARVAALRSGSVDLIDAVPPNDIKTLEGVKGIQIYGTPSARLIYLALDSGRDQTPFVTGLDGKKLADNPLKKTEVRKAISEMINRQLIVDRILAGAGEPAGQLVPEGVAGHNDEMQPAVYDPADAKKLLAEAGYPDGFGITIHSSNDRFPGDGDVAQAVGQMLARGGLKVNGVVTQPYNVYASAATKGSFSAFIYSLGNTTPTSATGLRNLLMTKNKQAGTGVYNRFGYSNPAFDKAMDAATGEFDAQKRIDMLADATAIAFEDFGVVPLYWQKVYWAGKDGIAYEANKAEDTTATLASKAEAQ